jgi:NAD(P)-dependent dehydrogenase (short-subunit alcohol dehydrogenase family)
MTELALERGDSVVATLRKPEVLESLSASSDDGKLLVLKVDVRIESEIADAFDKAKEKFGRIDVVFNNAGWAIGGEVEGTPEVTARDLFDTNFWGGTWGIINTLLTVLIHSYVTSGERQQACCQVLSRSQPTRRWGKVVADVLNCRSGRPTAVWVLQCKVRGFL